ncbi:hypothetical protein B0H12DRAFT_1202206 [Mycena haematopus]|nr:hypothetical protein B0H12DRAFT_1202206 [Mycena haematopus]
MPPRKKSKAAPRVAQTTGTGRKALTRAELASLPTDMQAKFEWNHGAYEYQMQGIEAQLQMRDCVVHAGTGMGKTTIAAGPHAHPSSVGKVTLMISPLIALHDEQVATFRDEFKLKAIAINSSHGGCKLEVLQEIVRGEHQIVLISPEMALSRRFIREVLRTTEFGKRVMSVVVDEAHVVSHWGASFRKKYGTLGMIRAFLPRGTPVVALSATLPARIRNDVLSKLQFGQDYVNIDVGNDRPNVSIIVRGIQHPLNTYADLKFVAAGIRCRADIKKTFIYADNIATGVEILDYLISLLPPELHDAVQGWDIPIRPYNAALSQEAGRAARASGRTGLAILLVEPSAYGIDIEEGLVAKGSTARGKKTPAKEKESDAEKRRKAKQRKLHAKLRGVNRGALCERYPPLDPEAADEGLLVFMQTGECRRKVLTTVYNNKTPNPTVPCCDICCLELLDLTCPGEPPAVARQSTVKRGQVNQDIQTELHKWRVQICDRDYPSPLYSPATILRDETVMLLASVGPLTSKKHLETVLAGQWMWWNEYGAELYNFLAAQTIPPMQPLPKKPRGKKRAVEEEVDAEPNVTSKRTHAEKQPTITAQATSSVTSPAASGPSGPSSSLNPTVQPAAAASGFKPKPRTTRAPPGHKKRFAR